MNDDLNIIADACEFLLHNFPKAENTLNYLQDRLSIDSIKEFKLGYFPNVSNIDSLISIVGEDILRDNNLLFSKDIHNSCSFRTINYCFFENHNIIIPYRDSYGSIVSLVGRTLLSDDDRSKINISKYKNTIFKKRNYLFGLYENKKNILNKNCVYIVEGQFDVIKSIEKGLNNIVGLGNSNMTYYQFALIKRYTDNIFLLLDNDEAGEKGRGNIIKTFREYANIQNVYLSEEYKDIDSYFANNSYEELSFIVKTKGFYE